MTTPPETEITFSYIKNRLSEHKKEDLLEECYQYLDRAEIGIFSILILMKWVHLYAESNYPYKELTPERFKKICEAILNFNPLHTASFMKNDSVNKAFSILYNQQFYLQRSVYKAIFATQLKLYTKLRSKYSIEKFFEEKTGLKILDFLFIGLIIWLFIHINESKDSVIEYKGVLDDDFLFLAANITSLENVKYFLNLLTLNPITQYESISGFRHRIKKEELQTMEISFFTMFPFQIHKNQIRVIHKSVFNHTINYFIYDFLKDNDDKFTQEFGYRLEKYTELGLKEINSKYVTETELKKTLPDKSNLVDFFIKEENIFIECKATELQANAAVNPTDDLLFNSLKSSIFKAYFEQLVPVSTHVNPDSENWGIIITYKELFWSSYADLFKIGKDKYPSPLNYDHMPPENVFIIDIYTWDKVVQIVKEKKATLLEILKTAKLNNSISKKQLFGMHLDEYELETLNLSYLEEEIEAFEIKV